MWNPLSLLKGKGESFLGIDVGTASIKVVELVDSKRPTLANYGKLNSYGYLRRIREPLQAASVPALDGDVAAMIRSVLQETNISLRRASLSIPLFISFSELLELPMMSRKELEEAIPYQAKQVVPLPTEEVVVDWEVVGQTKKKDVNVRPAQDKLLVMLVAVPREVIDRYVEIARLADIQIEALEVEAMSMVRALKGKGWPEHPVVILDVGALSTNVLIVDEGIIYVHRSIDTSGVEFTSAIAQALGIQVARAEGMKLEVGMRREGAEGAYQALLQIANVIADETEKLINSFQRRYGKRVGDVRLVGGSALLEGFDAYLADRLHIDVSRGNPFVESIISYPDELTRTLNEIGPEFTVAAGLALRNIVGE